MRLFPTRPAPRLRLAVLCLIAAGIPSTVAWFTVMPGAGYRGELPALGEQDRARALRLSRDVTALADLGPRNAASPGALRRAAEYIERTWTELGLEVGVHPFRAGANEVRILEVEFQGRRLPDEVLVVGAHYDTVRASPGADDNATGVAALHELARVLAAAEDDDRLHRTIRLVAFPNEEPPYFQRETMGSRVYADLCASARTKVVGMIALESLGYYDDAPGSQRAPGLLSWFYGDRGDFVAFVGTLESRSFVRAAVRSFREGTSFPSEGLAAPSWFRAVEWSDHSSFARHGVPALMITDTAPFRNPHYHTAGDRPETLDFERMSLVVAGVDDVVRALAGDPRHARARSSNR